MHLTIWFKELNTKIKKNKQSNTKQIQLESSNPANTFMV